MPRATGLVPAILVLSATFVSNPSHARPPLVTEPAPVEETRRPAGRAPDSNLRFTVAPTATTMLYTVTFDVGGSCNTEGWTVTDVTAQLGDFFHVDDYAGLNPADFFPLEGTKSLWCGARPQATGPLCRYATLPGYGNNWDQAFCTKSCLAVSGDGILNLNMIFRVDAEPSYDFLFLEYTLDCDGETGWTTLATSSYYSPTPIDSLFDIGTTGPVKFRFHFDSDGAWSDEDGLWNTNGAAHIDSLTLEGLPLEDFEDEAVDATSADDWESCTPPGYGVTANLELGPTVLQEDPCVRDLSCLWAFFAGSTVDYSCGGHPEQPAVPYGTGSASGDNLRNFIVSPVIPLVGSGAGVNLEFDVYRDLPLDNLVFYNWEVRTIGASGCPLTNWKHRSSVNYGGQKDWFRSIQSVGDLLDLANGVAVQVGLWAADYCWIWCGQVGTGACHSHAPLFDNVRVYRVETQGPQWSVADHHQFQDNFAGDGTLTGTVRADMSDDILLSTNPNILPGDSAVVQVADPVVGLATDPTFGGAAVYCYVSVWPQGQAAKMGGALTDDPARWPVTGTWSDAGGVQWTCVRLDSSRTSIGPSPDLYCIDLNDNLFTPGDTVCFFYAAKSMSAAETFASGTDLKLVTDDREEAAANPGEFTCLPAGGYHRGGDILYVDGMDGRGAQPAFDLAFAALGILDKVDRYDVRGPSATAYNRLEGRVANVSSQLIGVYRKILWDSGDLAVSLGDGSIPPEKSNDYGLLNAFLDGLADDGGVYLCGDDLAEHLAAHTGASAVTFRTVSMPYILTANDHRPAFGISPVGTSTGGVFTSDATFVAQGGCPLLNDFDVLEPSGTSAMEIAYGAPGGTNGGVLSNARLNGNGATVGVLLSGFSFVYIADDEVNGVSDRADHLHDVITWLGNVVDTATDAPRSYRTSLSQNYPNPFNPQTSIAFTLKDRGRVRLSIYDVTGALVRELVNENRDRGSYAEVWDGRDGRGSAVATGVYFCRLQTTDATFSRKMVLLK